MFYKVGVLEISQNSQGSTCAGGNLFFFKKHPAKVFFCEFYKTFRNMSFTKHLRVSASDSLQSTTSK